MDKTLIAELRAEAGDGSMEWGGPVRLNLLTRAADAIEAEARCGEAARDCVRAMIDLLRLDPDATYEEVVAEAECALGDTDPDVGIE